MTYAALPKRRKRERANIRPAPQLRCEAHKKWIRGLECSIKGKNDPEEFGGHECCGRIEAAHVRTGTDGGMGVKPSDNFTLPLCALAHWTQHTIGEAAFERKYGFSMKEMAEALAKQSPALRRFYLKQLSERGNQ